MEFSQLILTSKEQKPSSEYTEGIELRVHISHLLPPNQKQNFISFLFENRKPETVVLFVLSLGPLMWTAMRDFIINFFSILTISVCGVLEIISVHTIF